MKTLFVVRAIPHPPVVGSAQRSALLIEALKRLGPVDLFVLGYDNLKDQLGAQGYRVVATGVPGWEQHSRLYLFLRRFLGAKAWMLWRFFAGVGIDYRPDPALSRQLADVVRQGRYDVVVGRYLAASAQAGVFELKGVPVVVDIDDADTKVLQARIASPATSVGAAALLKSRLRAVDRWQKQLWPKAAMVWLSNPEDATLAACRQHAYIPNVPWRLPDRAALAPSDPDAGIVLWVGSFAHRVNLDGVELFLAKAWPEVVRRAPRLVFRIVGSGLSEDKRRQWASIPNVEVIGFAESLDEHYAQCAFSVVPLFDGAGTKIKVLESLGHLRTCVVAAHSIKGYESMLRDGDSLRVVDSLDEVADAIVELGNAPEQRRRMEAAGRAIVEARCSHEAVFRNVADAFQPMLGEAAPVHTAVHPSPSIQERTAHRAVL